jgi:nucleoside-diphosphate-sugar epimerase
MTLDGVRVLVTGGSGFVGLAVAQAAIAGGAKVALFADRPPPDSFLESAGARDAALRIGDVRSESEVAEAIAFMQPTHIVHAAALTPAPDREAARAQALLEVNVVGVANVLGAAAKAGVRRVVVMSSNSVYGPVSVDQGPLDESRALLPADLYGISKVSAEQIAVRLSDLLGVGVAIVRLGSVYGPFEYETGLRDVMTPHLQMVRAARKSDPARLAWKFRSDWIYSRDAARGILLAATHPELNERTFNVGSGMSTDLLAWGALLAQRYPGWSYQLADTPGEANIFYRSSREWAPLATKRFREWTGFTPAFNQEEAARDYLAWFDEVGLP